MNVPRFVLRSARSNSFAFSVAGVLIGSAVVACGGDREPAQDATMTTATHKETEATQVTPAPPPATTGTSDAPTTAVTTPPVETKPAPPSLTDDQILAVIHTANAGEVDQAKLAQSKATVSSVKKFAQMMAKDHTEADAKTTTLAKKQNNASTTSDLKTSIEADAKELTTKMNKEKGKAFDRAYIDAQVKEHQAVLDAIKDKLLPNAQSSEVKALLEAVREKVAHHLDEAKKIQETLAGDI